MQRTTITATIKNSLTIALLPEAPNALAPSWGTGNFLCALSECEKFEYCVSLCGKHVWIIVNPDETSMSLYVVSGNMEKIKELLKHEYKHFDCELVFVNS